VFFWWSRWRPHRLLARLMAPKEVLDGFAVGSQVDLCRRTLAIDVLTKLAAYTKRG
jgi:hypothetical protein